MDHKHWYEVARADPAATFFQTPLWSEISCDVLGATSDFTRSFELESGVRVVVPLVGVGRPGPMRHVISTATGCYGGLIADGPVSPDEATQVYLRVMSRSTLSFQFLESPLRQYRLGPEFTAHATARPESAWLIDLEDGFDAAYQRMPRRIREYHRSGIRKGVSVSESDSLADYRSAFDAYQDAILRWGESLDYGYGWEVFERIHAAARLHPDLIKMWIARVDGEVAGGRLVFYWNRHAVLWHGTARREFLKYRVIPIADIEVMRDAAARGYSVYDLNTSGDQPQVVEYKRRMGASDTPLQIWRRESPVVRLGRGGKRAGRVVARSLRSVARKAH
ncbi:MAG: GNAT family N-acetyltransferase [Ilumatobacteraceae bacterium]|nr:GNAT family N-acetyltransferase [Ilumatobacteraceae bacterium]